MGQGVSWLEDLVGAGSLVLAARADVRGAGEAR
jgi:hypothetical protein